ncbi:MAG: hypothetical protein A2385_13485 [Bdellovibrionales bacterium RIFOXYB1_FULL_39_21]|nr:MAG: hypothetical protein A2385_13485 [Bdellovibrionales bacterium RIFOXYB1_FULL_39_21]OFZ44758.1 MAG: hypothetical protein A2404_10860 [Bdellovibrionales bacterium RIFOXYC1_FULL_39_130]OFZ74209.1 MAG: hypothetical protein A2560_03525 [Bdellovibrionales bacterium RIFOXYD1_FULL_39_84]
MDAVVGVSILGIVAIVAIKIVEVRYDKKSSVKISNEIYAYVSKVKKNITQQTACRKTFEGRNLVRQSHKITSILNAGGTRVYGIGDDVMGRYTVVNMTTTNGNLDYDSNGIFSIKVSFKEQSAQGDGNKLINTSINIYGNVDGKGHIMYCYADDDGFIIRSLKNACRKLDN